MTRLKVLIVEDERDMAHMLQEALLSNPRHERSEIRSTGNREDAVTILESGWIPDLALVDINIFPTARAEETGVMDGNEDVLPHGLSVLDAAKRAGGGTKAIALTGESNTKTARKVYANGAAGIISKPISDIGYSLFLPIAIALAKRVMLCCCSPERRLGINSLGIGAREDATDVYFRNPALGMRENAMTEWLKRVELLVVVHERATSDDTMTLISYARRRLPDVKLVLLAGEGVDLTQLPSDVEPIPLTDDALVKIWAEFRTGQPGGARPGAG